MTGNELAKAVKKAKGKVSVAMATPLGTTWIYAEKADLIDWLKNQGEKELSLKLTAEPSGNAYFLEAIY